MLLRVRPAQRFRPRTPDGVGEVQEPRRQGYRQARRRQHRADERRGRPAPARRYRHSAQPRAARVGQVEGGVVGGGGQGGGVLRLVHDQELERGRRHEADRPQQRHHHQRRPLHVHRERERRQHHRQRAERAVQGRAQGPVRERARRQGAQGHPDTEEGQDQGDGGFTEAHRLGGHGREVRVHREDPREPEDGGEQAEEHLAVAEGAEFAAYVLVRLDRDPGHQAGQGRHRRQADRRDDEEGGAPAEVLAEQGRGRHADDVGDRQAEEHRRHRPRLPALGGQSGGDHRADAEERAVRESGEEAAREQPAEVGGERGRQVADGEQRHQEQQHLLARHTGAEAGEQGCAQEDADRVRRDEVAGGRHGRAQVVRHIGQQAHHDELGRADAEGAHGQGEQSQGHGEPSQSRSGGPEE